MFPIMALAVFDKPYWKMMVWKLVVNEEQKAAVITQNMEYEKLEKHQSLKDDRRIWIGCGT